MTFQTGAGSKRNNRDFMLGTNFYDPAHVRYRLREGNCIRRMNRMVGSVFAVLLTHGAGSGKALVKQATKRVDGGWGDHGGGEVRSDW